MIYLAIGSNLPTEKHGDPLRNCEAALAQLAEGSVRVEARSPWYQSAPLPASEQPDFINGVATVRTEMAPHALLKVCQAIENTFGRTRPAPANAARTMDIDIIDWNGMWLREGDLEIPHPRLAERLFVLAPLQDITPNWRHPVTGLHVAELVATIGSDQILRKID